MADLFTPTNLGDIEISNRIIMAPMTRSRADIHGCPTAIMRDYYAQRASAGLIISEGIYPCRDGKGYSRTPGIETEAQKQEWAQITDAVRKKGGLMVAQLMHCGRIGSHHNKDEGARTLAPSAVQARGEIYTEAVGMAPFDVPEAMSAHEIEDTLNAYARAAIASIDAGFVGVELHFASGYLPAQFLSTGTNRRQDEYGGSLENRLRFLVELVARVCEGVGAGRVGIRICPGNPFNDLKDDNPEESFVGLLAALAPFGLAYLHVIRVDAGVDNIALARRCFDGSIIVNNDYDFVGAQIAVDEGLTAVSFGRYFIANPDLVDRLQRGLPLAKMNHKTLYTPGPEGYIDYPAVDVSLK